MGHKKRAASQYDSYNGNYALILLDSAFVTFEKSNSDPAELTSFYNIKALINYSRKGNYKTATIDALKQQYLEDNKGGKRQKRYTN